MIKFKNKKKTITLTILLLIVCLTIGLIATKTVEIAQNKENEVEHAIVEADEDLNEYGFYFDRIYSADYKTKFVACVMFSEDGIMHEWIEYSLDYYEKYKDNIDSDFGVSTYEEANQYLNKIILGNTDGIKTNVKYDYLSLIEEGEGDGYTLKDLFFSENGKMIYNEKDFKRKLGTVQEKVEENIEKDITEI